VAALIGHTKRTKVRPAARRAEAANAARGFCPDAKAAGWPPRHAAGVPSARRVRGARRWNLRAQGIRHSL